MLSVQVRAQFLQRSRGFARSAGRVQHLNPDGSQIGQIDFARWLQAGAVGVACLQQCQAFSARREPAAGQRRERLRFLVAPVARRAQRAHGRRQLTEPLERLFVVAE